MKAVLTELQLLFSGFILYLIFYCRTFYSSPKWITGLCVVFLAILTAFKRVAPSKSDMPKEAETRAAADRLGYSVFIPPLVLAVSAVLVATFLKVLGANNAIGISGSIALVTAFIIFRPKAVYALKDCTRLTDNGGTFYRYPSPGSGSTWLCIYSCRCWRCDRRGRKCHYPGRKSVCSYCRLLYRQWLYLP